MVAINSIKSKLKAALPLLDCKLRSAIDNIPDHELSKLHEIRLRRGGKLSVSAYGSEYFVTPAGQLRSSPEKAVDVTPEEIEHTYREALQNSVYSFEKEICRGYVTYEGGCRVGFCGKAVCTADEHLTSIKEISSVNIRIAKEVIGCADELYNKLFSQGLTSVLIAGPPASGKTTVLRELCRKLSENYRISLIDERNEIAAMYKGVPQNDIGYKTDVFSSYPKAEAMMTAVRVMSPQIMICDEIGSDDELRAFEYALNSGIYLIAACHAGSMDELTRRKTLAALIEQKAFKKVVFLGNGALISKITACYDMGESIDDKA